MSPPPERSSGSIGLAATLLIIWLLLWGEVSPANVISGLAVVAALFAILPDVKLELPLSRPHVRPVWAVRFIARICVDLLRANWVLTKEVASPGSSIQTGIVKVPMPGSSDGVLTLVANVLALTPGTMPIEVSRVPPAIYIHVLHLHDVEAVRRDNQHLAALAVRAFGSAEAVAALSPGDEREGAPQ